MRAEARDRFPLKELSAVFEDEIEPLWTFPREQGEVERGLSGVKRERLHGEPRERKPVSFGDLRGKHDLDNRGLAQVSLGRERAHELLEGHARVRVRLRGHI